MFSRISFWGHMGNLARCLGWNSIRGRACSPGAEEVCGETYSAHSDMLLGMRYFVRAGCCSRFDVFLGVYGRGCR